MKDKLIVGLLIVTAVLAGCGRSAARRSQHEYEVVQEGSASGVTATIHGPGETVPPITDTNVDTTTAFTLDPNAAATATTPQPGSIAGTLPPLATAPPPPRPMTPQPLPPPVQPTQPEPEPQPPTQTEPAPEPVNPPPTQTDTAPPTQTDTAPPPTQTQTETEEAPPPPPPPPPPNPKAAALPPHS